MRYPGLLLAVLCVSCSKAPVYAPPPQQAYIAPRPADPELTMVQMGDPEAEDHILSGLSGPIGAWRWTYDRAELRFWLPKVRHWIATVDFAVAEATLKDTGPVTVKVFVNGRAAGAKVCKHAGSYRLETPVPPEWLRGPEPDELAIESRPMWVAPTDGQHLGLILNAAGFTAN